MKEAKKESIRVLVGTLESVGELINDQLIEEEGTFETRSAPSRGQISREEVDHLDQAVNSIELAIESMKNAIGDSE